MSADVAMQSKVSVLVTQDAELFSDRSNVEPIAASRAGSHSLALPRAYTQNNTMHRK